MKKIFVIALLVSFVIGALSIYAIAEDKVQRASKNVALGWTEIPNSVAKVTKDTDNPFLGITVGLLKGVANAFARTTSGVADVVTMPSKQNEPVIKPSMVSLDSGKGASKKGTK